MQWDANIFLKDAEKNYWNINEKSIPEEFQTEEVYLKLVQLNWRALKAVKPEFKKLCPRLCFEAVKQDDSALTHVPKSMETEVKNAVSVYTNKKSDYLEMVKHNGLLLKYVPKELKTTRLCFEAAKRKIKALDYVPEPIKNVVKNAVHTNKTPDDLEMVERNGCLLEYVPPELKTVGICLAAVKNDGCALQHVPKTLREDKDICLAAVKKDGCALQHVPKTLREDKDICLEAVKNDGCALQFVPYELHITELCFEAVKQKYEALNFVLNNELRDFLKNVKPFDPNKTLKEYCLEAVKLNGLALQHVPETIREDRDICLAAVKNNLEANKIDEDVFALQYVPETIREYRDICLAAVNLNGLALQHVKKKDKDICLEACKRNKKAFKYILNELKNNEGFSEYKPDVSKETITITHGPNFVTGKQVRFV